MYSGALAKCAAQGRHSSRKRGMNDMPRGEAWKREVDCPIAAAS